VTLVNNFSQKRVAGFGVPKSCNSQKKAPPKRGDFLLDFSIHVQATLSFGFFGLTGPLFVPGEDRGLDLLLLCPSEAFAIPNDFGDDEEVRASDLVRVALVIPLKAHKDFDLGNVVPILKLDLKGELALDARAGF